MKPGIHPTYGPVVFRTAGQVEKFHRRHGRRGGR